MRELDWYGCYKANWNAAPLVPAAYAHPAKVAFGLAQKIYEHCLEQGYIQPGDRIVDPFGGIAGFAFHAMRSGLHWTGIELEQKFVDLGQQNIALWNDRYSQWFTNWGNAQLIQGDSRRLSELVAGAQACVGSPPYAASVNQSNGANDSNARLQRKQQAGVDISKADRVGGPNSVLNKPQVYGDTHGQLGSMPEGSIDAAITSPPFSPPGNNPTGRGQGVRSDYKEGKRTETTPETTYGQSEGQLGAMPMNEEGFSAVVGSPPYAETPVAAYETAGMGGMGKAFRGTGKTPRQRTGGKLPNEQYGDTHGQLGAMKEGNHADAIVSSPPYADAVSGNGEGPGARHDTIHHKGENSFKKSSDAEYGSTPGNLGNMTACVGSPPYEGSLQGKDNTERRKERLIEQGLGNGNRSFADGIVQGKEGGWVSSGIDGYSVHADNMGNQTNETFWQAARTIIEQVYMVLKPGGVAVWVTKRFIRNKQIVEFSEQWAQLCESVGFERVEWIRAWVVEEKGTQGNLFTGEFETKTIERKSFFRRLAERKGSPRIDWEDVIIMRRSP